MTITVSRPHIPQIRTEAPIGGSPEPLFALDDKPPVTLLDVREYLRRRNKATRSQPMPVPLLGQCLFNRPTDRGRYGPDFVSMALDLANPGQSDENWGSPSTIARANEIFEALGPFREGPERVISRESKDTIRQRTEGVDTPEIRVGRQILELLDGHPAYGTAAEAVLAIQLDALASVPRPTP